MKIVFGQTTVSFHHDNGETVIIPKKSPKLWKKVNDFLHIYCNQDKFGKKRIFTDEERRAIKMG